MRPILKRGFKKKCVYNFLIAFATSFIILNCIKILLVVRINVAYLFVVIKKQLNNIKFFISYVSQISSGPKRRHTALLIEQQAQAKTSAHT